LGPNEKLAKNGTALTGTIAAENRRLSAKHFDIKYRRLEAPSCTFGQLRLAHPTFYISQD